MKNKELKVYKLYYAIAIIAITLLSLDVFISIVVVARNKEWDKSVEFYVSSFVLELIACLSTFICSILTFKRSSKNKERKAFNIVVSFFSIFTLIGVIVELIIFFESLGGKTTSFQKFAGVIAFQLWSWIGGFLSSIFLLKITDASKDEISHELKEENTKTNYSSNNEDNPFLKQNYKEDVRNQIPFYDGNDNN